MITSSIPILPESYWFFTMQPNERYTKAKKVTLIGALVNAILGFVKLIGGVLFHSHALVADGVHSFSDLITDAMVLFASKYGSQDADESHPYGHQRIETAATFLLALILILAGAGIMYHSINDMTHGIQTTPSFLALPIAILSILANEGLFHYTRHVGKHIHSDLIIANAWHHRSDAASSIVVLIGLTGSIAGYHFLDPLAAILVGLMVVKMGWSYGWNSVKELVDTAVDPQMLTKIERIICHVDGVKKIHQLRSRMMGQDIFVDVHILVNPFISVSEGHFIAQNVHRALINQLDHVEDVTVHVDPEDDEIACPSLDLPNRMTLKNKFLNQCRQEYPAIQSWVIHYIDGKLFIDLIVGQEFNQWQELQKKFTPDLLNQLSIASFRVLRQQSSFGVVPNDVED